MNTIEIIIETPKGRSEKFDYDQASGRFKLKKILPSGMVFPFDFGFIPGTKGEDGDPLDALVISEFASFPGCVIECRLIGALLATQAENNKMVRNDRFFFVPVLSKQFSKVTSIEDLSKQQRKEMGMFFTQYNKAEGKEFNVIKIVNPEKALKLITKQYE